MIIWQIGQAFEELAGADEVPELGRIELATGGYRPARNPERGDINLYWWWSFGPRDDTPSEFLESYLANTTVEPDLILCLSEKCLKEVEQTGYEGIHLPLGSQTFQPLGIDRSGCGYAGSPGHKSSEKVDRILGPAKERGDFAWVSGLVSPTQLNLWYNSRLFTLGLTKEGQRRWGMVNNRVFEVLASGTPFILEGHPNVEEILGFDFPYQAQTREDVRRLIKTITGSPGAVIDEFEKMSRHIAAEHTYVHRLKTLFRALS